MARLWAILPMRERALIVVPAWNEASTLGGVLSGLAKVSCKCADFVRTRILVVDDGSKDGTATIAAGYGCEVIRHQSNLGYGAALRTGLSFARDERYDYAVTIDADGQHRPCDVPAFLRGRQRGAVVSGSRYLPQSVRIDPPPAPLVNGLFTALVNLTTSLGITDVGCGLKCVDVRLVGRMHLQESGYLFPLEFWGECRGVSAAIYELPVPMIYCDPTRNIHSKFDSVEATLDRAVHLLLSLTLGVGQTYSPNWGRAAQHASPGYATGKSLMVRAVARELLSPRWDALPLRRARANISHLVRAQTQSSRRVRRVVAKRTCMPC